MICPSFLPQMGHEVERRRKISYLRTEVGWDNLQSYRLRLYWHDERDRDVEYKESGRLRTYKTDAAYNRPRSNICKHSSLCLSKARDDGKLIPDITLPAEERQIGGLGIYMVKKSMDNVIYEHRDGKNILTLMKNL